MSLPTRVEVEHADWPSLQRMCADLGLNPKGRSGLVRMRVLDHVRRKEHIEPWRPEGGHVAPLLTRLGFPEAATQQWESTLRLDAPSPWVGLGMARLAAGELDEAARAFERASGMRNAGAHLFRAEVLGARGDIPGALRACDAYLDARPGDLRGMTLKARFMEQAGRTEEAVEMLRAALRASPHARELWRGLGNLLLRSGRHEEAADSFHEGLRLDDKDVEAWVNRGVALLMLGRSREGIGALREALEIDPRRAEALNNLGIAYLARGQVKSGAINLERAAKHLEHSLIVLNAARAHEAMQQRIEARRGYERVLRIKPRDPEALAGRRRLAPRTRRKMPRKPAQRSARKPARRPVRKPRRKGRVRKGSLPRTGRRRRASRRTRKGGYRRKGRHPRAKRSARKRK